MIRPEAGGIGCRAAAQLGQVLGLEDGMRRKPARRRKPALLEQDRADIFAGLVRAFFACFGHDRLSRFERSRRARVYTVVAERRLGMALLRKCACYVLVCAAASSAAGCSEGRDPPPWISRCAAVGAGAELDLTVTAPADGSVRIDVEQRGLSVIARLRARSGEYTVSSPIDRAGSVTLVQSVHRGEPLFLQVISRDSPGIGADTCVSVRSFARLAISRLRAERAVQAAEAATYHRQWQPAFDDYALAARLYDGLGRATDAGGARQAMAQIAYDHLRRRRDS